MSGTKATTRTRQPRTPAGAADGGGGQFAAVRRDEPQVRLDPDPAGEVDRYGFPVVQCRRCDGTGRHTWNELGGDLCYTCGGTGHVYTPQVSRAVVAQFAAARRAAARPRVRDLRPGDVVSRPYGQLHEAHFRTVARVLVRTDRPTRFAPANRPGGPRRPVGFVAAIDYDDGGRDVVTTDAVYARRGAHVDPGPYVERALKS